jgi:polysaccharide pyruvyl transferase WcaK-like protein
MQQPKKKKILIMTATGRSNLGDELILREEIRFIRSRYVNIEITVATYNKDTHLIENPDWIKFISYFPNNITKKPLQNIWYFIQNMRAIFASDILIIGGGWIIFDNEHGVSFWVLLQQWFIRIKMARIAGTLILFWWISLEVTNVQNKLALKKLFVPGDFILVRDTRSKWLLEALEIPCVVIDDIVFLYEKPTISAPTDTQKRVGISVRGWFLEGTDYAIPQIYDFLVEQWYTPIFLVFSTEGDIEQNDSLYVKQIMAWRTYNVTKTIQQTLDIFPLLYATIGMRFHAGVLSCIHESPCMHISYGPKTDELISLLEAEHLTINPSELSLDIFEKMWHNLGKKHEEERTRLREKNIYIKKRLRVWLETI